MGGSSRAKERTGNRSFAWAWLTGAIGLVSIAPACASSGDMPADSNVGMGSGGAPGGAPAASAVSSAGAAPAPQTPPPPSCDQSELDGTYTVPVTPDLEPYASFDVPSIQFCDHGGTTSLSYDLPELLVGASIHLDFHGVFEPGAPPLELAGEQGTASCSASGSTWTCRESLTGIEVKTDKLRERVASLPPAEAEARTSVSDVFSQDPIGVLSFTTP